MKCSRDLFKKKKNIKTMNIKGQQTHIYQKVNLNIQKQTKQTTRTGTESQKWRSMGSPGQKGEIMEGLK